MRVYLAGRINGCSDVEAKAWRAAAKSLLSDTLDPMVRDYRGVESQNVRAIVKGDKDDILASDVLLMWFDRPSVGTSMEVMFAWENRIPVIVINDSLGQLSPWLIYHAKAVVKSLREAVFIIKRMENDDATTDRNTDSTDVGVRSL